MIKYNRIAVIMIFAFVVSCNGQGEFMLPLSSNTLRQIVRAKTPVPAGRKQTLSDVRLLYYREKEKDDPMVYHISNIDKVLSQTSFDLVKPTVFYAHGFVELSEDESVTTVAQTYVKHGGFNFILVDWSNLGFGSYILSSRNVEKIGRSLGLALAKMAAAPGLEKRLNNETLHLVGHSLGAHLVAYAARTMRDKGSNVSRLTGLDPAFPGYYSPLSILGKPISSDDANFVDIIHTDGGKYGTLSKSGHADFWPNEGTARQPGCPINSIPFTYEDFCSHWRSWQLWAESVSGGQFMSRRCQGYDSFLRGKCDPLKVKMGLDADKNLRGNFYLRTATAKPFALGDRGAE